MTAYLEGLQKDKDDFGGHRAAIGGKVSAFVTAKKPVNRDEVHLSPEVVIRELSELTPRRAPRRKPMFNVIGDGCGEGDDDPNLCIFDMSNVQNVASASEVSLSASRQKQGVNISGESAGLQDFLLQKVQEGIQSSFASLKGQLLSEIDRKLGGVDSANYGNDDIDDNADYDDYDFEDDFVQFYSRVQSKQPFVARLQQAPGMVEEGLACRSSQGVPAPLLQDPWFSAYRSRQLSCR